uniref:BTB domain-containing protein n=1 Tax=Panagrolaimus sp. ES5 TaxID=591445 RepID=A0AC34G3D7_9BILA
MFQKIDYVHMTKLSAISKTIIKIGENLGFDVSYKTINPFGASYSYYVENIKGDFEITKVTTLVNKMCIETRTLFVSDARLQLLKLHQYLKGEIDLNDFKFIYYVKKIKENGTIEIHIENPYDIEIEGKKGDYKIEQNGTKTINLILKFVYDPSITIKCDEVVTSTNNETESIQQNQSPSITTSDESRPESVTPSELTKSLKWYKIMSNERYADIFFVLPDQIQIPSHRSILSEASTIFAKIIDETSELPISINIEDFDVETIKAALAFLCDKFDSIVGKEKDDACCSFFEKSVAPSNVCEYIQIGYANNFEELKQKCLKMLVGKKKEVDASELANLPKNILVDFFNSY